MFESQKIQFNVKADKSRKKKLDAKITKLVLLINKKNNFYTTSSCSGRVQLFEIPLNLKKHKVRWLLSKHNKVTFTKLQKALNTKTSNQVWLKQENPILHVCCKTLKDSQFLINAAKATGFRRSGIISVNARIIVEISASTNISLIVKQGGITLISKSYLQQLVKHFNSNFIKNDNQIKALYNRLKQI